MGTILEADYPKYFIRKKNVPVMSQSFYEEILPRLCHRNCSKKKSLNQILFQPWISLGDFVEIKFVGLDGICYIRLKSHFDNGRTIGAGLECLLSCFPLCHF